MLKLIIGLVAITPTLWANAQTQDFVEYANCAIEDYIDIESTEVTIGFQGSSYDPACIRVKTGTSVTLPASTRHPLKAAEDFNSISNPFRNLSDHVENQTRILSTLGFYGYYCSRHADPMDGSGMGGMIWVVE